MAEPADREISAMNTVEARKRLVHSDKELGSIRATAQLWHTSRQVVRKWVARHQAEGEAGLEDRSRRPHTAPRQTPPAWEQAVLQRLGYSGDERIALFPPVLLGAIRTDLLLSCCPETCNDLLAHYRRKKVIHCGKIMV